MTIENTFKTVQGATSKTWTAPPIDGTLTVPEMFDFHLKHSSRHPFFIYHSPEGGATTITWAEGARAVHRAASLILSLTQGHTCGRKIVAILGVSDSITYALFAMGIMRAGHIPFPISPRNSAPIVTHLLNKTEAAYLFVSEDPAMRALAAAGARDVSYDGPQLVDMPRFEALFPPRDDDFVPLPSMSGVTVNDLALILHSSGSTAYPKPIRIKHHWILQQGILPWWGEVDLCEHVSALHSIPMFHFSGAVQTWWAAASGLTLAVLPPARPPIMPTADVAFEGVVKTGSTIIYGVSVHIESWSKDPEKVAHLKTLKAVIYQGAPLEQHTGRNLVRAGVPLFPVYGSTEAGGLTCVIPEKPMGEDFDWFVLSRHIKPVFLPQGEPGIFELVVVQTERHRLNAINTRIQEQDAYATSDLLVRHPSKPNLWKVYGRADDQIVLSTGEKVNPGPLEAMLTKDSLVNATVMFGRAKFNVGVLVEPKDTFDPKDEVALAAFRNKIWPTVETLNSFAPSHARLFKEMILVASPSKPFDYTPKGTPRRQTIIKAYNNEIEAAYHVVESSSQPDFPVPETWDLAPTLCFVRSILQRILHTEVNDTDDIFAHGCDSLQATYIRNTVIYSLRKSHSAIAHSLKEDFVYKYPTIQLLSEFIQDAVKHPTYSHIDQRRTTIQEMEQVIKQMTEDLPPRRTHNRTLPAVSGDIILMTGSTGALGANILAELLANHAVSRVYALNRTSRGKPLSERQAISFQNRGIDPALVRSSKLVLLEADTTQPGLGLSSSSYAEIRDSVTHVIHNAWPVDFNYTFASFKPTLKGLRNLIHMCLESSSRTPRFIFVSSISVLQNYDGPLPAPEKPASDLHVALGLGYGESKLAAEHILEQARSTSSLPVTIVRVGQLTGGSNGAWNTKEWFPTMVKSGQILGCLPQVDETIAWLPVHTAARVLVDLRQSANTTFHLIHPKPVEWTSVMQPISSMLDIPIVPYRQWLGALEASADKMSDPSSNPAHRLIGFYRGANSNPDFARGPVLSALNAMNLSPILRDPSLSSISEEVKGWMEDWRRVGFIQ